MLWVSNWRDGPVEGMASYQGKDCWFRAIFDEWHQPLSASQVAGAKGAVVAYVNGKRWPADPRTIPLDPHAVIQLDVGSPAVKFQPFSWSGVGL